MVVELMRLVVEAEDYEAAVAFHRDVVLCGRPGDPVEVGRDVARKYRVAFEVGDAAPMTDALVAAGASLVVRPTETQWRSRNACLEAPASLQLTLFEVLGVSD